MSKNRFTHGLRRVCLLVSLPVTLAPAFLAMSQTSEKVTPFPDFLRAVQHAQAKDFIGKPGVAVANEADFDQMKSHILKLYAGVHVHHSFLAGDQTIDCVPENEQPSLRALGAKRVATAPVSPPPVQSQAKGVCDAGTIPMRRITLEELTRFQTLDDYLHKAPHGRAPVPPA